MSSRELQNLRSSFEYLLVVHIPLVLTATLVPLAGYPLLHLPVHIVWLEVIIHPTAMLAFPKPAQRGLATGAARAALLTGRLVRSPGPRPPSLAGTDDEREGLGASRQFVTPAFVPGQSISEDGRGR